MKPGCPPVMAGGRPSVGRGFLRGSLSRSFPGEEGPGKGLGVGSRASGPAACVPPGVSWLARPGTGAAGRCACGCARRGGGEGEPWPRRQSLTHTHKHTDASPVNHPARESAPRIPVGERARLGRGLSVHLLVWCVRACVGGR